VISEVLLVAIRLFDIDGILETNQAIVPEISKIQWWLCLGRCLEIDVKRPWTILMLVATQRVGAGNPRVERRKFAGGTDSIPYAALSTKANGCDRLKCLNTETTA